MFKLLAVLSLIYALFTLTSIPWFSSILYIGVSVLQPQYVWFWAFDGFPMFKLTAVLVLLAWIIQAGKKNINYQIYKLPVNKALLLLTLLFNMSHWFASYNGGVGASIVVELFNTIMLMYFACIGLIQTDKALWVLASVFLGSILYYGYDSNMAYLSGDWSRFVQGRLVGPRNGAYNDNNKFAVLLVIGVPFLILGYFHFKSTLLKLGALVGVGLLLHAIFLTGSRGALLAVGAAVFMCTRAMGSKGIKLKFMNALILCTFAGVVLYQASGTLSRTQEVTSEENEVANPRLLSWKVGLKLIANHPILGVGVHRFRIASHHEFPGESPHVAHNTFITFAANSGLACGVIYLYLLWCCFLMYRNVKKNTEKDSGYRYIANSAFAALIGFYVGAMFLDMIVFEPFYYLIMLITLCFFKACVDNTVNEKNKDNNIEHSHV